MLESYIILSIVFSIFSLIVGVAFFAAAKDANDIYGQSAAAKDYRTSFWGFMAIFLSWAWPLTLPLWLIYLGKKAYTRGFKK